MKQIPSELSSVLKSQQYTENTSILVKELIENSIDAAATEIIVSTTPDTIVVDDNGCGIDNLTIVGGYGVTSKEENSRYILGMGPAPCTPKLGFRGLALHAISQISDLKITTRIKDGVGQAKNFTDSKIIETSRGFGTSVYVSNIFKNCPVRRKLLDQNYKKNIVLICKFIKALGFVNNIKIIFNSSGKHVFTFLGQSTIYETARCNLPLYFNFDYCEEKTNQYYFLISRKSHQNNDNQYIYINDRPVKSKSIHRGILTAFNLFSTNFPVYFLSINMPAEVNLTVCKDEFIVENEPALISSIYEFINRSFSAEKIISVKNRKLTTNTDNHLDQNNILSLDKNVFVDSMMLHILMQKENSSGGPSVVVPPVEHAKNRGNKPGIHKTGVKSQAAHRNNHICHSNMKDPSRIDELCPLTAVQVSTTDSNNLLIESELRSIANNSNISSHSWLSEPDLNRNTSVEEFDLDSFLPKLPNFLGEPLTIEKRDFLNMSVLGQFNYAFIMCRLEKNDLNHLIIIDQHASDEMSTFHRLRKSLFVVDKQQLIFPLDIKLSEVDKIYYADNMDVFSRNGFILDNNFHMIAVPSYSGHIFNEKDFFDLMEDVKKSASDCSLLFHPKLRSIMASKACRSSVMFGTPLKRSCMERIVKGMFLADNPWTCPHGRPTISLLFSSPSNT